MTHSIATDNINTVTGSSAPPERRELDSNYQDFLKLLTTQLQNQSPTDPADSNEITAQIATLSQVEQQISTNDKLGELLLAFQATQYNSVVSYIGKQIEAVGDVGTLKDGSALFAYSLEREAATVEVTITDTDGNTIATHAGDAKAGRNEFIWDGKDADGNLLEEGTYKIHIKALDGSNNEITSVTYATGVVTSIDSVGGTVYLSFGDVAVPVDKVLSIRQPSIINS